MNPEVSTASPYAIDIDLSKCDKEPIHLISVIQHHAALVACNADNFIVTNVSKNLKEKLGYDYQEVLGGHLCELLDVTTFHLIETIETEGDNFQKINPIRTTFMVKHQLLQYNLIVHKNGKKLILEFEPYDQQISSSSYQYKLSNSIQQIQNEKELDRLYDTVANELKQLTGFDRIMVYKFDDTGNGEVIAEAREEELESYLGLHYPASDIPAQARKLFLLNRVRLTTDITSQSSPIHPVLDPNTEMPLDLTHSVARGVSPVHLEYLANMGVKGTLSIAISVDDKLWGLFACHHYSPKFIDYNTRVTCGFIAQIFSGHLALHAANEFRQEILQANLIRSKLFEQIGQDWNLIEGLMGRDINITKLIDCSGACVFTDGKIISMGQTPAEEDIWSLIEWLDQKENNSIFYTRNLSKLYPDGEKITKVAAGVLAIKLLPETNNHVIWFRPEMSAEVNWAGDPNKSKESKEGRISPRKSFSKWSQKVGGISRTWEQHELNAALSLRNDIVDFIIHKYNKVRLLNQELKGMAKDLDSFSQTVAHDLRMPMNSISDFVQVLIKDHGNKLDETGQQVVNAIINRTSQMNTFINDILAFSKLGQQKMEINEQSVGKIVEDIFDDLILDLPSGRMIQLKIQPDMPSVFADKIMLRQLIAQLLSNSIKYTSNRDHAIIEIGGQTIKNVTQFYIKDNGVGFDMEYVDQIFGFFTRLVNDEEFDGNGVGLTIAKRIVDLHKGKIYVESVPQSGTTFFVKLPGLSYDMD